MYQFSPWTEIAHRSDHRRTESCTRLFSDYENLSLLFSVLSDKSTEVVFPHLYNTELKINEISLSQMSIISNHSSFQQVECLYACVESVKSWFEVFFTISPNACIGFLFSILSQSPYSHNLCVAWSLCTGSQPSRTLLGTGMGFKRPLACSLFLIKVINSMEQVAVLAGLANSDSVEGVVFSRTAKMFRSIRPGWEAILVCPVGTMVTTSPNLPNANGISFPEDFPDHQDNDWLTISTKALRNTAGGRCCRDVCF